MIKNLIFDVGGVLLGYRWKEMLMDYGCSEREAVRIGTELFEDPERLWSAFDLGVYSDEEIIERYCRKYPDDTDVIRWFITHGENMHVPRPDVWEKVRMLKEKGYRIYILSNYPESLFEKHTSGADFMDAADGALVSYMIHKAKPEQIMYDTLCGRYGLEKSECLFFDDRIENVEGAIAAGIDARQVFSQEMLIEMLDDMIAADFK